MMVEGIMAEKPAAGCFGEAWVAALFIVFLFAMVRMLATFDIC